MKKVILVMLSMFCLPVFSQTIQGIDVSYHQGDINWQLVSADGKSFAYVKSTEGKTYTDPKFQINMEAASSTDVVMGAYHFARPDNNSASEEADNFIAIAGAYIGNGYLPPALDLENTAGNEPLSSLFTQAELSAWVQSWLSIVELQTGVKPIIYTSSFYANYLNESLNSYHLWIPKPGTSPNTPPSDLGIWNNWIIKQYSWEGNVEGITGFTDLNSFNGTASEFNDFISGSIASLDCSSSVTLNCGELYLGSSSSAISNVSAYGCNSWTETGPERVHSIIAPHDGRIIATISNFSGDLDVYILGSCDPADCLGTVYSSQAIFEEAQANHEYFIVVDSDDGSGSSYDLVVDCFELGVPDVRIDSIWTYPQGIEIDDNVDLYVKFTNIGYQTSSPLSIDFQINNTIVETISYGTFSVNESQTAKVSDYNFSSIGEYNFCVKITPLVNETNTVNNDSCIAVNVLPNNSFADITVSNATVLPKIVNAGESIQATAYHNYSGNQNAEDVPVVELGFYLSEDCVLSADDVLLGVKSSNLGLNNPTQIEELSLLIPTETSTGEMFIIFKADNSNKINEGANENNNELCIKVSVKNTSVIKNKTAFEKIELYPNPVSNILNIKKNTSIKIDMILIYNQVGKLVRKYDECQSQINFTELPNNIYYVNFISPKGGKKSFQIIKN